MFIKPIKTACASLAMALVLTTAMPARAQSDASVVSMLPLVSVAVVVSAAGAVSTAALSVPVVLSAAGATFVVKAVEVTASGTIYVLERVSDGVRVSLQVAGQALKGASQFIGAAAVVTVLSTGAVVSLAGEVIAFVPNAIGQALLYNERITY